MDLDSLSYIRATGRLRTCMQLAPPIALPHSLEPPQVAALKLVL